MTKPLRFTKSAIKRAIAAARDQGAASVEMLPDGTIRFGLRQEYEVATGERPAQTDGFDDEWGNAQA